jgi:DNA-binding MarR family transcriptional regulator
MLSNMLAPMSPSLEDVRPATINLLKDLSSALRAAHDKALAATGMTTAQLAMLSVLHDEPNLSNADLARLAFVQPQSTVPLLKALEARGWVVRQPHPAGGRSMPARLTSVGAENQKIGWAASKAVEVRMLCALTKAERSSFRAMLEACLQSLGPRT